MTGASAALPLPAFEPPRAAAFIVTLYGDVVEPRGGVLWMGSLIALCAEAGLSETLVRTAVSRLVVAGQLAGERDGRRSYYSLSPLAREEFQAAARAIFRPPGTDAAEGWLWLFAPQASDALRREGFVEVAPGVWLGPDRDSSVLETAGGGRMRATTIGPGTEVAAFAARHWDLAAHAARYRAVLGRFSGLVPLAASLPPEATLALRLRLVHDFRLALLRDPRLPAAALPRDWPGPAARQLFCRLYTALGPAADAAVAARLEGRAGPLPAQTPATAARLRALVSGGPTG